MQLSVVATLYRSSVFIDEFCDRIAAVAGAITPEFEIVLVNDGSPDDSLQRAVARSAADPRVTVVDLSRNFGHHAAIVAGLAHARGALVYLTDVDLEEQPEWLTEFHAELTSGGHDVVFGQQEQRIGSSLDNLMGRAIWKLLNAGSLVHIPENQMTCRLMTRRYLEALLSVGDRVLYLGGVFPWVGFDHKALALNKQPRPRGAGSSYTLGRKLNHVVASVSSFTTVPLTVFLLAGMLIWAASVVFGIYLVVQRLLFPEAVLTGFTSLMFSIWFLGGLIVLGIGIVGQYVARIFQEVKARPLYITRAVIRGGAETGQTGRPQAGHRRGEIDVGRSG